MESYTKPLANYKERASQWGRQGLGLHLSLRAYSVFIASVLGFVTQLEPLPTELFDTAEIVCAVVFSQVRTIGSSLLYYINFGNSGRTLVCRTCGPLRWLHGLVSFVLLQVVVLIFVGGSVGYGI